MKGRRIFLAGALSTAVIAAAGTTWLRNKYHADFESARIRIAKGSRVLQTRAGVIEIAATEGRRPLLMVHGTGGGFDQGLQFSEPLQKMGWAVISPSRFGYLRTPFPADASSEAQADQFAALLDELRIEKLPLLGGSAGALSVIQFALRHPQRCSAMVPIVPASYVPTREATPAAVPWAVPITERLLRSDFLYWFAIKFAPNTVIASLLATDPVLVAQSSREEQERVRRILWNMLPVSERALGMINDARLSSQPVPVAMEQIRVPTLAVSVEDDRFGTFKAARHIAATVPGAKLVSFPTGGHIWAGHDAELFAQVDAFLRTIPQ